MKKEVLRIKVLALPLVVLLVLPFNACKMEQRDANKAMTKMEMLQLVAKLDNQFSVGVKTKDSMLLVNIYSETAQYVIPKGPILKGKDEIGKDWGGFLKMKEEPIDLILNIKEVSGTREIIYETGTGFTLLADSTKWTFNYVNVWRLQPDGSYKLEIDTYN